MSSAAYEESRRSIHRLVWGIPKSKRKFHWIMATLELRAAIDDSGSSAPEPYFALAGFISDADSWEGENKFLDRWQAVLDEPPALEYFKRSEAFRAEGQFRGWSANQ